MQLFAGACGRNVENAPVLLRLALAIDPINPGLCVSLVLALALKGSNQKLGNLSRFAGFGEAALHPREHSALAASIASLQLRNNYHLEFQSLCLVDGHQLHAALAAGFGVGQGSQLFERRSEARAEQVRLAVGQPVEASPEKIEVGPGSFIRASRAAQ